MNKLLERDRKFFNEIFPEAHQFLNAAHLRHETFDLICRKSTLNQWEKDRLAVLRATPACCDSPWFDKLIDNP